MSQTTLAILGVSSAVTNTVGLVPYIKDTFLHKTKPERSTWWIWSALNIIALSAQIAAGATWSLFMTGAQTLAVLVIAILSVRFGYGVFKRKDLISLLIAMSGLIVWKYTKNPLSALLIVIAVDMLAFMLTVIKTWRAPHTETLIAWVFASLSGTFGVLSVGGWDFTKIVYPLYIMLGNWLLVWVIVYRRPRVRVRTR